MTSFGYGGIAALILLFCVLACDSPPWSRCIIANNTNAEMIVRFYTPHAMIATPCVYSPEDWKNDAKSCTYRADQALERNDEENWFEGKIPSGGAIEIDRYRYPDIEEDVEHNFLIDRLDIHGSIGDVSWIGRRDVFNHLKKEGGGSFWYIQGESPRYVLYYK